MTKSNGKFYCSLLVKKKSKSNSWQKIKSQLVENISWQILQVKSNNSYFNILIAKLNGNSRWNLMDITGKNQMVFIANSWQNPAATLMQIIG